MVGICAGEKGRSRQGVKVSSAGEKLRGLIGASTNSHAENCHEANDLLSHNHLPSRDHLLSNSHLRRLGTEMDRVRELPSRLKKKLRGSKNRKLKGPGAESGGERDRKSVV